MKDSFKLKVLDTLISEYGSTEYPGVNADEVFERFAITEVLKPKTLSADQLEEGIVDGTEDGGIDAVFTFLNGQLLSDDSAYLETESEAVKNLSKHPILELILVQSKNKTKWEERVWSGMLSSVPNLLDPEAEDDDLLSVYNESLVEKTGIYRRAVESLAVKFPKIKVTIFYATRAPESNISAAMQKIRENLGKTLKRDVLADADLEITYAGVAWLYERSNTTLGRTGTLTFTDLIRTAGAYIGTATLADYLKFLMGDDGCLAQELFEANVRDYEGANRVNESIAGTLGSQGGAEFWWRNNGITVLASDANCPANTMTLEMPYIVNGLQTSHVLVKAHEAGEIDVERLRDRIVVRVIVSDDEAVRDAVISGTNMQTAISSDALHASDAIQNDIERFFLAHGWYYERRKNFYKNQSMPAAKRVSILYLSQAIMALALGEPHTARARPTTLLTQKDGYKRVFNDSLDCDAYLIAVKIMKEVDAYLKSEGAKNIFEERTNARYYLALVYFLNALRIKSLANLHFAKNAKRISFPLDNGLLKESLAIVSAAFSDFPEESNDRLSKRQDFRDYILTAKLGWKA